MIKALKSALNCADFCKGEELAFCIGDLVKGTKDGNEVERDY